MKIDPKRLHRLCAGRISVRRRLVTLFMLMLLAVPVGSQEAPAIDHLTFDSVIEQAISASGAISMLQDTLADQLAKKGPQSYLQGIGISVSGAVSGSPGEPFSAAGVRHAFLDVEEAEIDLSGARWFSPSLSVTASTALPDLDYSVGAQFSFSISDFDLEARDSARKNLSHAGIAYENTLRIARFDVRKAVLELDFALEELEAARETLAESRLGLAEIQYFAKQGKATELELAQSELSVRIAENNVVSAEIEVASRWFAIEFAQY